MPEVMDMNSSQADRHEGQASIRKTLRFRVDNVPLLIRPLYLAVVWIVGVVLYLYISITLFAGLRRTSQSKLWAVAI